MSLNQEEEEYIERLYREMYTRLCIYAMSALGSKALAEEVVRRYTMLEAAEELGITVEACKKRVQRAKKKLQKIIEKDF